MQIVIVVGLPAAGKDCARKYAALKNYAYFSTGDIVRAEVRGRGLDVDPENLAAVSGDLRGADGLGVTRQALKSALAQDGPIVFLEGMRSWPEICLIREQAQAMVLAVVAPRGLRRARIASRGRADDSAALFDTRDEREIAYGAAVPVALADAYILNTATLEEALAQIDAAVSRFITDRC